MVRRRERVTVYEDGMGWPTLDDLIVIADDEPLYAIEHIGTGHITIHGPGRSDSIVCVVRPTDTWPTQAPEDAHMWRGERIGLETSCRRCGHTWRYKGQGYYAPCPRCHTTVRVTGRSLP